MSDNFWRQAKSSPCIQTYTNVMRLCCGMVFGIPAVILKIFSRKIMGLQRKPEYVHWILWAASGRPEALLEVDDTERFNQGKIQGVERDTRMICTKMPNGNFSSIFIWEALFYLVILHPFGTCLPASIEGRLRSSAKSGITTSAVRASSCLKLRLFRMVTVILMIFFCGTLGRLVQ